MMDRRGIIEAARAMVGTPYAHQARLPGVAIDCVGVVICVARAGGWVAPDYDVTGYGRRADGHTLMDQLGAHLLRVREPQPGDVVCVAFDRDPQHVGIAGDYRHGGLSIIHAVGRRGAGVVETRLMFSPAMRLVAAFGFPGVTAWQS